MTEPTPSQIKREFLKTIWKHTKSTSLVRECKAIYEGGEKHALL